MHNNFLFAFFLIILIAFSLSFATNLITRKVVDLPRVQRYQKEIDKWKKQEEVAKKSVQEGAPNRKLMIKVQRKKKYIEKLQRNMATERMKPSLFTFVPFLIMFLILSRFVFGFAPVAIFPFNIGKIPILNTMFAFVGDIRNPLPNGIILYYYGWYSICLFTFNTILQRIMGTRMQ